MIYAYPKRCGLWLLLILIVTACQTSPTPSTEPTGTPEKAQSTSTPLATSTAILVPSRTIAATPTLFITPPASGQTAAIPILMYHHLEDLPASASELDRTWTVMPKNFQSQMELLVSHGFHTISMADLATYLRKGKSLPAKPIVITFDDGWETGYSVAYPILKRNNLAGTFYVYTNAIGHGAFLKWPEIDEMARAGQEFGSHTLTHPHLRDQPTETAKKEIVDSKAVLEKRLGRSVTSFAYPFGEYSAAVTEMVRAAGYESAVSLASGYKQRVEDIYSLHRIRVSYSDSLQDLSARLP